MENHTDGVTRLWIYAIERGCDQRSKLGFLLRQLVGLALNCTNRLTQSSLVKPQRLNWWGGGRGIGRGVFSLG